MSVLLDHACGGEGLASSMSEECCDSTSSKNIYIAGRQEITKLKVLELCVLLSKQSLTTVEVETELSDWLECS